MPLQCVYECGEQLRGRRLRQGYVRRRQNVVTDEVIRHRAVASAAAAAAAAVALLLLESSERDRVSITVHCLTGRAVA